MAFERAKNLAPGAYRVQVSNSVSEVRVRVKKRGTGGTTLFCWVLMPGLRSGDEEFKRTAWSHQLGFRRCSRLWLDNKTWKIQGAHPLYMFRSTGFQFKIRTEFGIARRARVSGVGQLQAI